MAKKKRGVVLGLNCTSDYSITDENGKTYTIEEARKLYEGGGVDDYNLSFFRLVQHNFDIQAVKDYFMDLENTRRV
jgi:hypothetical protein